MREADLLPAALRKCLQALPKIAIALSGGVDSRFLCHAARLCCCDLLAVHVSGPHIPAAESQWALAWAQKNGITCLEMQYNPLNLPEVAQNRPERCYFCKKGMLMSMRKSLQVDPERILCEGSHAGDAMSHRPGKKALVELGVISPLALAGMDKAAIRQAAENTGLEFPEQLARPCLLTRFPYFCSPSQEELQRLGQCEREIASTLAKLGRGKADFRLRLGKKPILQITEHIAAKTLLAILEAHGFAGAEILVQAQISGFFDQPAKLASLGPVSFLDFKANSEYEKTKGGNNGT